MKTFFVCLFANAWISLMCLDPETFAQSRRVESIAETPWSRHIVDNRFQGADGVRFADFDGDGRLDIVTGWEESGLVCLYLNPGPKNAKKAWPSVIVGREASPEDAVPCDLDGDGNLDIVSCHEGRAKCVLVHWNNASRKSSSLTREDAWETERIETLEKQQWMYALPIVQRSGTTMLALGSKNADASITLLEMPKRSKEDPQSFRDLSRCQTKRIRDAGWIMSLEAVDMDGDEDLDIVFTDRKGADRGAGWLEQPDDADSLWPEHSVTAGNHEVMFLSASKQKWLIATRDGTALECVRDQSAWAINPIKHPANILLGKSVSYLPNDCVVMTANTSAQSKKDYPGIWLCDSSQSWSPIDLTTHVKFDRIELVDLDEDGDLDVVTCEERQNLGIVWYENPTLQITSQ